MWNEQITPIIIYYSYDLYVSEWESEGFSGLPTHLERKRKIQSCNTNNVYV